MIRLRNLFCFILTIVCFWYQISGARNLATGISFWYQYLVSVSWALPFFSILRPRRTAGLIFTLYGSNDVFPRKDGTFGVRTKGDHIWGKYAPKTPKNGGGVNRQFQAKTAKYTNRNISKTINRIKTKLKDRADTDNCTTWVVQHYPHQIQYGCRPPS